MESSAGTRFGEKGKSRVEKSILVLGSSAPVPISRKAEVELMFSADQYQPRANASSSYLWIGLLRMIMVRELTIISV